MLLSPTLGKALPTADPRRLALRKPYSALLACLTKLATLADGIRC